MFKSAVKALLALTPFRLVRDRGANRFEGVADCLDQLAARGYRPAQVIDCGAHAGDFALMAKRVFPAASLHMVEPQPACQPVLAAVAKANGFSLHAVALGAPEDAAAGALPFAATDAPNTGAHVVAEGQSVATVMVPVATLDSLFDSAIATGDRALLKLDLQGYELAALKGATALLSKVEVVLTEVSFFAQAYEPPISVLTALLDQAGFELYDIASVHGRARDNRARQGDFVYVRRGQPLAADTAWA